MHRDKRPLTPYRPGSKESGAALVMGLIILVLVTLLGVTAIRTTSLEERMAGQNRDAGLALQAAEAALRQAERYLNGAVIGPFTNKMPSPTGLYSPRIPGDAGFTDPYADDDTNDSCTTANAVCKPWWEVLKWTIADSLVYTGTVAGVDEAPRYIIENVSGKVVCEKGSCTYNYTPVGGSLKFGTVTESGIYRITARGVGGQTDDAGNPVTVVMLQSYYRR